ncbi:hypothetical protein EYB26_009538 [Talaromyces marneffei]|uniref:uncharacterized protein n=1 Tax=Talaromyces marneffei TaxID=37727 RepID=UPI0012A976F2|nr:uncharacterized protein EYB26_009538 [Talaromyces marneffei]QGA21827.1 hypothetical protein EYB26_009538 [Talaromyces marneffei]
MASITVVDTDSALQEFLTGIENCKVKDVPPSLYFDLEGVRLGRNGTISIISVFIQPLNQVYLIDVFTLSEKAFLITNDKQTSLKTILEAPSIPKVFFDVRNDSDAMCSHHGIRLQCVKDLQVMELAVRFGSQKYVAGLTKCIENHANLPPIELQKWKQIKASVGQLWDPRRGGSYQVFNQRPIRTDIIQYCAQDVTILPSLWNVYHQKLRQPQSGFWRCMVFYNVEKRIAESQGPRYNPEAESKRYGWTKEYIEQERDSWNDDIMDGALQGEAIIDKRWLTSDYY